MKKINSIPATSSTTGYKTISLSLKKRYKYLSLRFISRRHLETEFCYLFCSAILPGILLKGTGQLLEGPGVFVQQLFQVNLQLFFTLFTNVERKEGSLFSVSSKPSQNLQLFRSQRTNLR